MESWLVMVSDLREHYWPQNIKSQKEVENIANKKIDEIRNKILDKLNNLLETRNLSNEQSYNRIENMKTQMSDLIEKAIKKSRNVDSIAKKDLIKNEINEVIKKHNEIALPELFSALRLKGIESTDIYDAVLELIDDDEIAIIDDTDLRRAKFHSNY